MKLIEMNIDKIVALCKKYKVSIRKCLEDIMKSGLDLDAEGGGIADEA